MKRLRRAWSFPNFPQIIATIASLRHFHITFCTPWRSSIKYKLSKCQRHQKALSEITQFWAASSILNEINRIGAIIGESPTFIYGEFMYIYVKCTAAVCVSVFDVLNNFLSRTQILIDIAVTRFYEFINSKGQHGGLSASSNFPNYRTAL